MNHLKRKSPKNKTDISEPQNFVHVKHMGLKDVKQKGFVEQDTLYGGTSTGYGNELSEVTCR